MNDQILCVSSFHLAELR